MLRGILFVSMIVIVALGLHYTGFVNFSSDKASRRDEPSKPESSFQTDQSPWDASRVPRWDITDLKGQVFSLDNLKGQVVLLNFWASWCQPCWEEFPELIAAVKWSQGKIALVAVSQDSSKKDMEGFLSRLRKAHGVRLNHKDIHIIWDPEQEVAKKFHTVKLPETFILDTDLRIVKKQTGVFSFKELKPFLISVAPEGTSR